MVQRAEGTKVTWRDEGEGTISFYSLEIKRAEERLCICHVIGPLDAEATGCEVGRGGGGHLTLRSHSNISRDQIC